MVDLSPYRTQEATALLRIEEFNWMGLSLGLICYGMLIIAFGFCVYYLFLEKNFGRNWKWFLIALLLFFSGTFNVVVDLNAQYFYLILYRNYPGGPAALGMDDMMFPWAKANLWTSLFNELLVLALLIFRCRAVYNQWSVLVLPILIWTALLILGPIYVVQASFPHANMFNRTTLQFSIPFYIMSLALNFILAGMLISRLFYIRNRITKALGPHYGKLYADVASLIIESSLVYGIISFVALVMYAQGNEAANVLLVVYEETMCISPLLTILRVSRGRAISKDTISDENLSRLKMETERSLTLEFQRSEFHSTQTPSRHKTEFLEGVDLTLDISADSIGDEEKGPRVGPPSSLSSESRT